MFNIFTYLIRDKNLMYFKFFLQLTGNRRPSYKRSFNAKGQLQTVNVTEIENTELNVIGDEPVSQLLNESESERQSESESEIESEYESESDIEQNESENEERIRDIVRELEI